METIIGAVPFASPARWAMRGPALLQDIWLIEI
jgi:hypothetical protein